MVRLPPPPLPWNDELLARFWGYYGEWHADAYFTKLFGNEILAVTRRFLKPGAEICDYGCGVGYLLERLLADHRAAGYDYSAANVEEARRRLGVHRNLVGVYPAGEGASGTYDVVYCVEVVEHLLDEHVPSTLAALRALVRADGGRLIVTTPHDEDLAANTVFCPSCSHTYHRWQHMRSFDARRLTAFMGQGGFEPVEVFTTDFAAQSPLARLRRRWRTLKGSGNPHLVWVGRVRR